MSNRERLITFFGVITVAMMWIVVVDAAKKHPLTFTSPLSLNSASENIDLLDETAEAKTVISPAPISEANPDVVSIQSQFSEFTAEKADISTATGVLIQPQTPSSGDENTKANNAYNGPPPLSVPMAICNLNPIVIRVSVASDGTQANDRSVSPSISDDGRFIVFSSSATNLVPDDTNGRDDIFLYDRQICETIRISMAWDGGETNGLSATPIISPDGRFITYMSSSTNLIENFSGGATWQIYLHDRQTSTTTLISKTPDGAAGDKQSRVPVLSADGRYIVFQSQATDLVDGITPAAWYHVFLHDTVTGETTFVSRNLDGNPAGGDSINPTISDDGHYVAFASRASDLVADDTNGNYDIFIWDRVLNAMTLMPLSPDGFQADGNSSTPHFTADGRFVVLVSEARNLMGVVVEGNANVFVYDQDIDELTQASVNSSNAQVPGGKSSPGISDDGRFVVFVAGSDDFAAADANGVADVYLRDRTEQTTRLISVASDGITQTRSYGAALPVISGDGRYVAYQSDSGTLVSDDTNNKTDIFLVNVLLLPSASPYDLMVEALSRTELQLTWVNDGFNADEFHLETSPDGLDDWAELAVVGGDVTSFTIDSLECNTFYYYRVRALSSGIFSSYSPVAIGKTLPCAPIQIGPDFVVNVTEDASDGTCDDLHCSLREAIIAANDYGNGTTVTIPAGEFVLSIPGVNEDFAATGDLDIRVDMTITGAGAATTIIDGGGLDRVLHIPGTPQPDTHKGATVTLRDVTVQNGALISTAYYGGGIAIGYEGDLTIERSHIQNNSAASHGGAFYLSGATLSLVDSTVNGNTAASKGGALFVQKWNVSTAPGSVVNIINSTISGNSAAEEEAISITNSAYILWNATVVGTVDGLNITASHINSIQMDVLDSLQLGPLQDNGGPTWTHALQPASIFIGAGDNATCQTSDQRGISRNDGGCDLGAYEADFAPFIQLVSAVPSTENGSEVEEGELTGVSIETLNIHFSETMFDPEGDDEPNDVTNPDHFRLVDAGGDGILQTLICGPLQGDDQLVIVDSVSFESGNNIAAISFGEGISLPSQIYRLFVCGTVLQDLTSNALDVDRDGAGTGEEFVRNFTVQLVQPGPIYYVNTTEDVNDGFCGLEHCSLREAIIEVNGTGGGKTIEVPAGTYTLTIEGYEDQGAAGDLDIARGVEIIGAGADQTIIDGNHIDRVFHIQSGADVRLYGLMIRNGQPPSTSSGGAILIQDTNTNVLLSHSAVMDSIAGNSGGGIALYANSQLTVRNSTISGNMTTGDDNPGAYGRGGGIFNWGTLIVENSTISGNSTNKWGGGLLNYGTATLNHMTITGNTADSDSDGDALGGGIYNASGANIVGNLTLKNTIVAGNTDLSGQAPDCAGGSPITVNVGHNLIEDSTGCDALNTTADNLLDVDPLLATLQNNGNTTATHALQVGSPAIDAANAATCLPVDQRGVARSICDIGAYEYSPILPADSSPVVVSTQLLTLPINVRQAQLTFSRPMFDPDGDSETDDVTNPANYQLIGAGADEVFSTSTCGPVLDDDIALTINEVVYSRTLFRATITFNDDQPLPGGLYRLLACGSTTLMDVGGHALDGNIDGVGGDDYIFDFLTAELQTGPVFVVNTTDDTNDTYCDIIHCSLREAINAANVYGSSAVVDVPAGTYELNQPDILGSLMVSGNITVQGAGPGQTIVDANQQSRVFTVNNTATIRDLTVTGGYAADGGGLLMWGQVQLENLLIENNISTGIGGGVAILGYGYGPGVEITNSVIRNNQSTLGGGGIGVRESMITIADSTIINNSSQASGGGIYTNNFYGYGSETGRIVRSAVYNNTAESGGGISNALYTLSVINSTISGNTATNVGGGIWTGAYGQTSLNYTTITENQALADTDDDLTGGGIFTVEFGATSIQNTILYGNTNLADVASDCGDTSGAGVTDSLGHNLIGEVSGCTFLNDTQSNLVGVSPLLGPLQDNGGTTWTHGLLAGSPAVDAGNNTTCPAVDQRNIARPQRWICDIGAYEDEYTGELPPVVMNVERVEQVTGGGQEPDIRWVQAVVTYSETMQNPAGDTDPDDVTNPANYRVIAPGTDNIFQTAVCGPAVSDDVLQVIDGVVYDEETFTAILNLGPASAGLPPGNYRLLVCGSTSVKNLAGLSLDGNRDTIGGDDYVLDIDFDQTGVYTVNATADVDDGTCTEGHCSLREAVIAANAYSGVATIYIPEGFYALSIAGTGEDLGASGDLDIRSTVRILGASADQTIIDGGALDRVFDVQQVAGTVTIENLTIQNGAMSELGGGGISSAAVLTLRNSIVQNNLANYGGGLFIHSESRFEMINSTVRDNVAVSYGAGLHFRAVDGVITDSTISGNVVESSSGFGGGLYIYNVLPDDLVDISSSTIHDNIANKGGGIYSDIVGRLYLTNSTISGNTAYESGGGIASVMQTETSLLNVTVAFNRVEHNSEGPSVTLRGGGIYTNGSATVMISNTLIANNSNEASTTLDCATNGTLESLGHNLIQNSAGCNLTGDTSSTITGQDPLLGSLQNNGGPTWTHALALNSPAKDAGDLATCADVDQRGLSRVQGANCDIGAFEVEENPFNAPANLAASLNDHDQIELHWEDKSSLETSFLVERGVGSPSGWVEIAQLPPNTTLYQDSDIDPVSTYFYRVRAYRSDTDSYTAYSNIASLSVPDIRQIGPVYTVNNLADDSDPYCRVDNCALADAIRAANARSGLDTIEFNLSGPGPYTIQPGSPLPVITDAVIVDGWTQPGFSGIPLIEINGSSAPAGSNGLEIGAGYSTIRGLVINAFENGILLTEAGNNVIVGNYIGTDRTGTVALPNVQGIRINFDSGNNIIGGFTAAERNLISGNTDIGMYLWGHDNVVQGNYVGVDVTGNVALGNRVGIYITDRNQVGGTAPGAGNVVSGNHFHGIGLGSGRSVIQGNFIGTNAAGTQAIGNQQRGISGGGTTDADIGGPEVTARNVISGNGHDGIYIRSGNIVNNYVGVDITGTVPLGNGFDGIALYNNYSNFSTVVDNVISNNAGTGLSGQHIYAYGNIIGMDVNGVIPMGNGLDGIRLRDGDSIIGSANAGEGNLIAYNQGIGVRIVTGTNNPIVGNQIFENGSLGIEINNDGQSPNDFNDIDTGANQKQNYPIITFVSVVDNVMTIQGTLNSLAETTFGINVYGSQVCDPTGYGEGEIYLGHLSVTTDENNLVAYLESIPVSIPADYFVTATATDPQGNTSEFSACVPSDSEPAAPSQLVATLDEDGTVLLGWQSVPQASSYYVERSLNGSNGWTEIAVLGSATLTYHDSLTNCFTDYVYRVRAYRSLDGQYSPHSEPAAITSGCPPLFLPVDLVATSNSYDEASLTWTDTNTTETGYLVEHSLQETGGWLQLALVPENTVSVKHERLTCHSQHYYRVSAIRSLNGQRTLPTDPVSILTLACPSLEEPEAVQASNVAGNSLTIAWVQETTGTADTIYVERADGAATSTSTSNSIKSVWSTIAVVPTSHLSFPDSGLACGRSYLYRIRAFRMLDNSFSPYSEPMSVTMPACPEPFQQTIGLYQRGTWNFWESFNGGASSIAFVFGPKEAGWQPITGDWDGDGIDGIGLYKNGLFLLRQLSNGGPLEQTVIFGPREAGWQPITGDWNGDGIDGIGLYKDGLFLLRETASNGSPSISFSFGSGDPNWIAVAGDWNGSGSASVGLFRGNLWLLSNALPAISEVRPITFMTAQQSQIPVVGDWNGDGTQSIGIYQSGRWHLRNNNTSGGSDVNFTTTGYSAGWYPVANFRGEIAIVEMLALPVHTDIPPSTATETPGPASTLTATVTATNPAEPTEATATLVNEVTKEMPDESVTSSPTVTITATPTTKIAPSDTPTLTVTPSTSQPTQTPSPSNTPLPASTLTPTVELTMAPTLTMSAVTEQAENSPGLIISE